VAAASSSTFVVNGSPTKTQTVERTHLVDMQVIVRRQDQMLCASITCMIRHYVARRAKVIFDHPHNAAMSAISRRLLPAGACG
jgi:hypothetical protein